MKKKRSILCCLLCTLLSLFGVFSSYAFTATESNAYKLDNAKEFQYNYVPLKLSSSLSTVTNTVDLSLVRFVFFRSSASSNAQGSQYCGTDGHVQFTSKDGTNIQHVRIDIPNSIVPSSGTFNMSLSYRGIAGADVLSCYMYSMNKANGAEPQYKQIIGNSSFSKSYTDIYLAPTPVTMKDFDGISIRINLNTTDGSSTFDGYFALRFEYASDPSDPTEIGNAYNNDVSIEDTARSSQQTAENTSQLVYSQNETNGLLHDIIQHISDQLAAMWDQIYNLMAVPWIQNDNQRTNNTISAIEENSENEQTTIIEQTHWHGNFIIEGLKSLFIPSDEYFSDLTDSLYDWFDEKFGFLGYTLTYFIRLLNGIMNASQNTMVQFPGIRVPNRATNEIYEILPAQSVDLGSQIGLISEGSFSLLEFMRTAGDIVLVLGFVVMLQNKLHEVETS